MNKISESNRISLFNLRKECDPNIFTFETTADFHMEPEEIIGQERALKAMDFGLSVEQFGYNIFVAGPSGTGKTTFTNIKVQKKAKSKKIPGDWCYVYNFVNEDMPSAIALPPGKGKEFQQDIAELFANLKSEINKVFSSDEFNKKRRQILSFFQNCSEEIWMELDQFAKQNDFQLERATDGIHAVPLKGDEPLDPEEYNQMDDEAKKAFDDKLAVIEEKIDETLDAVQKIELETFQNINVFLQESVKHATTYLFKPYLNKYASFEKVIQYLNSYAKDVIENYSLFLQKVKSPAEDEENILETILKSEEKGIERYKVHVFVNNSDLNGAPVIVENNPTYHNLIGKIEYKGSLGNWVTNFTQTRPGALHLANGGYLILQASQILKYPYSWSVLKRMLQEKSITIDSVIEDEGISARSGMKPEAIPLNVKVIIIGSTYHFEYLNELDEEFNKLFKVKVEFHTEMARDDEHYIKMASFIKNLSEKEGLLPFHKNAVARVIDHSSRIAEDQRKLSTRFQELTKLLVESSYWASMEGSSYVDLSHIHKAIEEKNYRSNYIEEKLWDMIADGSIMVDTEGKRVGQINGLAVMGFGDHSFGVPSKITAQTFAGYHGIINVERETSLSGEIHNKGLLILSGYLSGKFAKERPLPFSASITFEQTYNMIDGDSASSTELYVLLSSLSRVPIKQGIAVTGSVNQWGEIQPIGGVNEKIEGFYFVCKRQGLTGEQGVIIPHQNVKNLMLCDEVIAAVQAGKFNIWSVKNVNEGIEILTGISAGEESDFQIGYPEGTIFHKIEQRLKQMYGNLNKR